MATQRIGFGETYTDVVKSGRPKRTDDGTRDHRALIGPHEGREPNLMLAGTKPLSMFVEAQEAEAPHFPEDEFDAQVSAGRLRKEVSEEVIVVGDAEVRIRRALYAFPPEQWRIPAMLLVEKLYASLLPGWRPDLDRLIGMLLGYKTAGIEEFLARTGRQ